MSRKARKMIRFLYFDHHVFDVFTRHKAHKFPAGLGMHKLAELLEEYGQGSLYQDQDGWVFSEWNGAEISELLIAHRKYDRRECHVPPVDFLVAWLNDNPRRYLLVVSSEVGAATADEFCNFIGRVASYDRTFADFQKAQNTKNGEGRYALRDAFISIIADGGDLTEALGCLRIPSYKNCKAALRNNNVNGLEESIKIEAKAWGVQVEEDMLKVAQAVVKLGQGA